MLFNTATTTYFYNASGTLEYTVENAEPFLNIPIFIFSIFILFVAGYFVAIYFFSKTKA